MKLHLAPMEGVVDFILRDLLTSLGGIDQVVTEFIRVTDQRIPDKVFLRDAPELANASRTRAGTLLYVQLLGSDPSRMAENALAACELGAAGIDLNFGCPAKTVNRHQGGAALLKCSSQIEEIVASVRKAVPSQIPVTAKMRLGFSDPRDCLENAKAIENGGASRLTIHCRTKEQMYKPSADWSWLPRIKEIVKIPLIANGDLFSVEDLRRCEAQTGCQEFMIGRGALVNPFLFTQMRGGPTQSWASTLALLRHFLDMNAQLVSSRFAQARTKQWLREIAKGIHPEAQQLFDQLKVINDPSVFKKQLWESNRTEPLTISELKIPPFAKSTAEFFQSTM